MSHSTPPPPPFNNGVPPIQPKPPSAPQNLKAIFSLVLGIVGLLGFCVLGLGVIPAIAGVIVGLMARKEDVAESGKVSGMTLSGLIVSSVAAAVSAAYLGILIAAMVFTDGSSTSAMPLS